MPDAIAQPPAAPSPNATPAVKTPAAPTTKAAPSPTKPATSPSKPATAAPEPAAKVVNPFDQANADMERFTDPDAEEPKPPGAPKSPAKPAKPAAKPAEAEEPEAKLDDEAKPGEEAKPEEKPGPEGKPGEPAAEKPGKTSPWKLVESYKKSNAQLQQEIAELRTSMKPGELPKEHQEKFAAIEARNKELEDEIRHVNFSKSKEFAEQYQKPYEEAWVNAIADLKELVITNEDGSSRAATAQDLIALSNMPLGQARATAKEWFGDSADDVMAHRRTIRDLSDKQTKALEESKKGGSERDQQRTAEMQAKQKARSEESAKVWKSVNEEAMAKYEYLRPVEGETERNEKLEKAQKFVDETLKRSVNSAKTEQERDEILRSHAAVRNRAIGFSTLKHENASLRARVAELEKSMSEFQASEPSGGEPRHQGNGEPAGDEMGNSLARLANYVT